MWCALCCACVIVKKSFAKHDSLPEDILPTPIYTLGGKCILYRKLAVLKQNTI